MHANEANLARLKYVFQNMDDAVLATKMNGELVYANPSAGRLFGLPGMTGTKLWKTIPLIEENDDLIQLFIDSIMNKRKNISSLVDYVNADGTRYKLHVSLTCDAEESGIFLIVISDLTELIKVHSAFQRYTSPEIADYVLTAPGGEKQGGTDREVTILMSDLRGFTALSSRIPCDDLITMLNHYFECMSAVIDGCRGTIIEFLGDGLFVVFGAPKDQPDHAEAAVTCAIRMQNGMAAVNEWNRSRGYPDLEMGIAIHSGMAVVGNIGSDKRMKYGCMGETVNLAGRLETYSIGGQVLVSEHTAALLPEKPEAAGENTFMPKGGTKEIVYYDVTGLGEERLAAAAEAEWVPAGDRECPFYELDGKTVSAEARSGKLTRITADERWGILVPEGELAPLQNLMLRLAGKDVYAKVVSKDGDGYRICFTSKPDSLFTLLEIK